MLNSHTIPAKPNPSPDPSDHPFNKSSPTSRYSNLANELRAHAPGQWAVRQGSRSSTQDPNAETKIPLNGSIGDMVGCWSLITRNGCVVSILVSICVSLTVLEE